MKRTEKVKRWRLIKAIFLVVFCFFLYFFLSGKTDEVTRRVFSIFVFAGCFWAFEILPLYATSLATILLLIFSLCFSPHLFSTPISYHFFISSFANPIIILFLGGFTLSRVMNKYQLDQFLAHFFTRFFGNSPYCVLLGFMCTTAFFSMWISNTATTAMMLSMIRPILDQFDKNTPFKKGFLLSIPFGANIGGMGTPIGTPPNAIALGILENNGVHISFLSWLTYTLPLLCVALLFTSLILYFIFPPSQKNISLKFSFEKKLNTKAKSAVIIILGIISLWLTSRWHSIPEPLVALLAIGLFASFGYLTRTDFKKLEWDILILMWGGFALGKGVHLSHMADWFVQALHFIENPTVLIALLSLLSLLLSSFMSRTVAANVLLPLLLSIPHISAPQLIIPATLISSFAMIFPISTPPNAMAFSLGILRTSDMVKAGLPIALFGLLVILLSNQCITTYMIN